jgi:hypothetical protein
MILNDIKNLIQITEQLIFFQNPRKEKESDIPYIKDKGTVKSDDYFGIGPGTTTGGPYGNPR